MTEQGRTSDGKFARVLAQFNGRCFQPEAGHDKDYAARIVERPLGEGFEVVREWGRHGGWKRTKVTAHADRAAALTEYFDLLQTRIQHGYDVMTSRVVL